MAYLHQLVTRSQPRPVALINRISMQGGWTLVSSAERRRLCFHLCPFGFITCQNFHFWQVYSSDGLLLAKNFQFWQVCSSDGLLLAKIFNFGKYVRLTVCLSVCLSGSTLLTGYRSHRLTNHRQTSPKCVSWSSLEIHLLCRSKVK